ncbi:MAG: DUF3810 domain-containing protein [Clostridia bacterium]|nr:DUF3810 domain-containing protein [Clostridia bacterium]
MTELPENKELTKAEEASPQPKKSFVRRNLVFMILGAVFFLIVASYVLMRLWSPYAEFINTTVGAASRRVITFISDIFPFSLAEAVVFALPFLFVLAVVLLIRKMKKQNGAKSIRRITALFLGVICFLVGAFVFNGSPGYFGERIYEKLELNTEKLTEEELYAACVYLEYRMELALRDGNIVQDETGATVMPYSVGETAYKLSELYNSFREAYGFPQSFRSNPKILVSSPLVTYTHVSGLYCDYTGEININVNYPDYVITSTIAHEMAHQRGVAPEDEANFMAYATLTRSNDPYLVYAGCLDAFNTVAPYLRSADADLYKSVVSGLPDVAKEDLVAYAEFFNQYRDNKAAEITGNINDSYLKSQGTSGTVSYDEATYLIVRYILQYQSVGK